MKEFESKFKIQTKMQHVLRFSLLVYFLVPYFIFLTYYNFSFKINYSELVWVLKNSIIQSGTAALIVVLLSVPMSQGLFFLPAKAQGFLKRLLIVPQILPALYSVLIAFSLLNPFPMGNVGIVFLFVLVNLGFATLLTYASIQEKLGNLAIVSELYSLGRLSFYTKVFFPLIRSDLMINVFIIFVFCLSSFSIPLIAGGGKGTNIEVLIFEKIYIEQNWPGAFALCFIQSGIIFMFSFFIMKNRKANLDIFSTGQYLKSPMGLILILTYLIIYFGGYALELIQSFMHIDFIFQYAFELVSITLFTTKTLLFYLILNFVLLILWLIDYLNSLRFNLAANLISVSTVLLGFSFYLALPLSKNYDIVKIVFAMSILVFPMLFKLFLQKAIEGLRSQIIVAQIYGLTKPVIIFEIILKQISYQLFLWFSFLVIWFVSEYALLRALGVQTPTLGLLTEGFLSSYRLPLSFLMSFYILIYWAVMMSLIYIILRLGSRVSYVVYKKLAY